ncbi:MAG TPA: DNA mismatch repair protein MutS [Stellaceae bacterium]|nr:DNA mismatch repair protein MutS [Stellaceae bacterium]
MMAQFLEIKRANPDCLLFYRMGDFYELFFEDAVKASAALDITLTRRGKHDGADIPMCGVPVHASETYLSRLIRQGFKVAVCEQIEDPAEAKKRGGKSPVRRAVIRVVTPGTITEDSLLDARRHNYLLALGEAGGELGLAWLDLSTGDFHTQSIAAAALGAALARLDPEEILAAERLLQREELFDVFAEWKSALTPLATTRFDSESGRKRLAALYGVASLDGFGSFGRAELAAAGALVDYVEATQQGKLPRLAPPRRMAEGAVMEIDAATRRNLELVETLTGERRGSLLASIDRTVTGAGARLLAEHLAAPLTDPVAIGARLDAVQFFAADERLREDVRIVLRRCPDIERALSRISLGRGGPRDLAALRDTLGEIPALRQRLYPPPFPPPQGGRGLDGVGSSSSPTSRTSPSPLEGPSTSAQEGRGGGLAPPVPSLVADAARELGEHEALVERLARALAPELPLITRDGGFIAEGYAAELDELRALRDHSRKMMAQLQARYAEETGIASLKIRHNNVLGYYIEVTPLHAGKLSADGPGGRFIHRQTMASAMRFTTVELGEIESRIASAADKALALELALFEDLVGEVIARAAAIAAAAAALAALDVAAALAELAIDARYTRPEIDDSTEFAVKGGRHPVVEMALAASGAAGFIANDCDLKPGQRLWLLTGPNMAGKSTFLRQNALIAILAQIGSFVPADAARIGIVDRLFSRVGAADDLARGRSTFMVEMVETAAILNLAGPRALVILDEIGRGTATYDGLSIAWACVEHLHDGNRCRALFATHYHELTALASKLPDLACHSMRVKEWQGDVVFLHEVAPGAADRSYGIHVAKLAGLPPPVIARATAVLETLEKGEQSGALARLAEDLPLFSLARRPEAAAPKPSVVERALGEIRPDELTPRDALEALYRLKGMLGAG